TEDRTGRLTAECDYAVGDEVVKLSVDDVPVTFSSLAPALKLSSSKGQVIANGMDSAQIDMECVFTAFNRTEFTPDNVTVSVAPSDIGACSQPTGSSFTFTATVSAATRAAILAEDAGNATISVLANVSGDDGVAELSASIALGILPASTATESDET